nr:hypothetical protein GCM10020092_007420 [Actinoplanes digitatis]
MRATGLERGLRRDDRRRRRGGRGAAGAKQQGGGDHDRRVARPHSGSQRASVKIDGSQLRIEEWPWRHRYRTPS